VVYDVVGGTLSSLRSAGLPAAGCVATDVAGDSLDDHRPDPAPGDGYYYLVRAENACGDGGVGAARDGSSLPRCDF